MIKDIGPGRGRSRSMPRPAHSVEKGGRAPRSAAQGGRGRFTSGRGTAQDHAVAELSRGRPDVEFLRGDATRGIHLQLDFLKAETLLEER